MRRCLLLLLCSLALAGRGAADSGGEPQNSWQMPDRVVEFGLDLDLGFGNSLIKLEDVFNFRKTLLINLTGLAAGKLSFQENAALSVFLNINLGKELSLGLFSGVQVDAYQSAPEEFTELLRRGNIRTRSMNLGVSAGGAVFVDAGMRAEAVFDKLRLTVKPAVYIPLVYLPPMDANIDLDVSGSGMVLNGSANMDLYSAVPLEMVFGGPVDLAALMFLPLGFDLGLEGTYTLLPVLDLGLGISQIPLYPARLRYRMRQELSMKGDWSDLFNTLTSGSFDLPVVENSQTYTDDASFTAFRPLRFDFFAEYRPAVIDLFVFRPHIGFSLLTIFGYDTACFNMGLEGRIKIANILGLSLYTGYVERLWKHAFGFSLNFRALELNGEISLRGPDILSSLKGMGIGAFLGIKVGF
jgi:hypothetical protein